MNALAGRAIVITRPEPGELGAALVELGAEVMHVPLIKITPRPTVEVIAECEAAGAHDWLVVTSPHGADVIGEYATANPNMKTAAVGRATAERLARHTGRPVDVVPTSQIARALVDALPDAGRRSRVVVARSDQARPTVVDGLRSRGYDVTDVIAYRNTTVQIRPDQRQSIERADMVVFASGSAARSWAAQVPARPCMQVAAIGPATAAAASVAGLAVTRVAESHSVDGLVDAIVDALSE